jgi:hypothetical protein
MASSTKIRTKVRVANKRDEGDLHIRNYEVLDKDSGDVLGSVEEHWDTSVDPAERVHLEAFDTDGESLGSGKTRAHTVALVRKAA